MISGLPVEKNARIYLPGMIFNFKWNNVPEFQKRCRQWSAKPEDAPLDLVNVPGPV